MAVVSTRDRVNVTVRLNNGTDSSGGVQTLSVSMPKLSNENYADQKIWNVKTALEPILEKPVYDVKKTEVSTLANDE